MSPAQIRFGAPAQRRRAERGGPAGGPAAGAVTGTPPGAATSWGEDNVHLGRQPLFDRNLEVVGFELLFRRPRAITADVRDPEQATADVVVKTFADFGLEAVVGPKLAFVNLPRGFLTGQAPLPFSPQQVVLEVLEDVIADDEVLDGVRRLKERGFRFALDDFALSPATEPLLELCDFVKLDVLEHTPAELTATVHQLRPSGVKLLAEKVETAEQLELCQSLAFDYFQGYLLSRPTVLTRRSLDSTRLACLRLLSVLGREDYDIAEAEAAIRSDPGLTLRVLRMVNSAAAGLRRKVSSVREAILVLGPRSLVGWVLLMSMSGTTGGSAVNVDVALTRARMCELLSPHGPASPGPAFTVGLVASLDLLLGLPLAEAIEDLPLDNEVTEAVLRQDGALGRVLADVLAYEAQTPTRLVSLADARASYVSAMAWTQDVLTRAGN